MALLSTFSSIRAPRCGWYLRISNASSANFPANHVRQQPRFLRADTGKSMNCFVRHAEYLNKSVLMWWFRKRSILTSRENVPIR